MVKNGCIVMGAVVVTLGIVVRCVYPSYSTLVAGEVLVVKCSSHGLARCRCRGSGNRCTGGWGWQVVEPPANISRGCFFLLFVLRMLGVSCDF
jgi:hypothetical protein